MGTVLAVPRNVNARFGAYYGKGYQEVQNRVPKIDNTTSELG